MLNEGTELDHKKFYLMLEKTLVFARMKPDEKASMS